MTTRLYSATLRRMTPRIEQIAIGDELLDGRVVDENSAWLGRELALLGVEVQQRQVVADRTEDIVGAFRLAAARADLVVVSGGLGPTSDDLTAEASAAFIGEPLALHPDALEHVRSRKVAAGRTPRPIDEKQALLPKSATVRENRAGIAPAFEVQSGGVVFIHLPGVPREYRAICEDHVLPLVRSRLERAPVSRTWKFFGVTETEVAERAAEVLTDGAVVHYRAHFPEIHLSVVSHDVAVIDRMEGHLRASIWRHYFGDHTATFAGAVVEALAAAGQTVATAESCTGGLIGQLLTSVPGSSAVYVGGAVSYSNALKSTLLGVPAELIEAHGAVSEPVARAMAEGARALGATWGIGTTGIAGPGGGSAEKPVGTVHLAVAGPEGTHHRALRLPFDRDRNRLAFSFGALDMLRRRLPPR